MSVRILLVDDHRLMRQGLRLMLEDEPDLQIVGEADNGRSAVAMAAELKPDVVIMDVTMPELNGIDATLQIRATNPRIKVVAVSMHVERQFITKMLAAKASAYLPKDSQVEELLAAIRTALSDGVYVSPKIAGAMIVESLSSDEKKSTPSLPALSPREREVLQLVAEGKNAKEIGLLLDLSVKTVEAHRRQIMEKLNADSVAELTRYAIREGITVL
jgi:DNA-binding NarL/FixJ family response regulator